MPTVVHLTDLHLFTDPDQTLKEVCTRRTLERVLGHLRERVAAEQWTFELLILTGDLAHDESRPTYEALRGLLGDWLPRCRVVPGNHDHRDSMRSAFPTQFESADLPTETVNFSDPVDEWRVIGLDTHLPGELPGRLDADQLGWLDAQLTRYAGEPTILFLHHPPFLLDSPWLDEIGLQDAEQLWRRLEKHPQVRVVSSGHVHQEVEQTRGDILCLSTPSTGVQFLPGKEKTMEDSPPGYRLYHLDGDAFRTEVVRVI